jgi:hypothetical protein
MVASTGKTGRGVSFQIDLVASPVTLITVGNARSISLTGRQADEIDFTHLLSTGGYRELRQGFKDGGSIGVEFHFDPTDDTHVAETDGLLGLFESGDVFNWRINFSGAGWAFALVGQGFISNPGDIDINVDGPITGNGTVRNTGPVTLEPVV